MEVQLPDASMKLRQQNQIKKKFFHSEGDWALEQAPQESGHSTSQTEFKKCLDNTLGYMV